MKSDDELYKSAKLYVEKSLSWRGLLSYYKNNIIFILLIVISTFLIGYSIAQKDVCPTTQNTHLK